MPLSSIWDAPPISLLDLCSHFITAHSSKQASTQSTHSVDGQLKQSVSKLEGDWKLKGPVMVKAVVRQPLVGVVCANGFYLCSCDVCLSAWQSVIITADLLSVTMICSASSQVLGYDYDCEGSCEVGVINT